MTPRKLEALRELLRERKLDGYIVPSADQHSSEYPPAAWRRREWITRFTGSAGDAVVTLTDALLWTDSRYFLQAAAQLEGSGFRLMRMGVPGQPTLTEWVGSNLPEGASFGYDPRLLAHERAGELDRELRSRGVSLKAVEENLVDLLRTDLPALPGGPVERWEDSYAGESVPSKVERVREKMRECRVDAHVLARLDDIAWLFNIRGSDVPYNPLVIAFALVTRNEALLFVQPGRLRPGVLDASVEERSYDSFGEELKARARQGARFWVDPAASSRWIVDLSGGEQRCYLSTGPVPLFKAVKNATEIEGMRRAHLRDGVALVRFLVWLEEAARSRASSELDVAKALERYRALGERYRGPSFEPIVGYREHGAIVHYAATPESAVVLAPEGLVLVDSGGHYLDGTTDVTRTIALGRPTDEQRARFTLVLKGHVALARACFPRGTSGTQLDVLARKALWDAGLNYGHGTGHGVGAYLSVHEGPHSISPSSRAVPLEPGMVVSNEPGYYEVGSYGIRTENLVYVAEDERHEGFLRFVNLTLCPIDRSLIDVGLLDSAERRYLDSYHAEVREALSPSLGERERSRLERATAPL